MNKNKSGFTIVELLIVIVVVGILAAITIVAYNGIQERARIMSGLAFERQLIGKYSSGATGFWDLDDCAGSTIRNTGSSSSSDTISPGGVATWITDTPSKTGCALKLNGSTRIETLATLGGTNYVKAAWVRMSATSCAGSHNVISQAATNGVVAAFYLPSCIPATGHNGAWNTVTAPRAINDGKWHHVAVIWESGIVTLYLDGKSVDTDNAVTPTNVAAGTVSIGAHAGGNYMTGDIDNILVSSN